MLKNYPREFLDGERIFLRRHELAVAPAMFACVDADRARLREFLPWVDATKSVKDSEEYIRLTHVDWMDQRVFDFGIYRKPDRQYLGNVGVHAIAWEHECCELGYWISGKGEGKGFVTEAVQLLEAELFGHLRFHRIEIRCNPANQRSAAVPKRLGYALEGQLRENKIENGARRDTLIFGKLRKQGGI